MFLENLLRKIKTKLKLKSSKPKLDYKPNQVSFKRDLRFQKLLEESHRVINKILRIIKTSLIWPEALLILENIKEKTLLEMEVNCLKALSLIKTKRIIIIIKRNQDLHLVYQERTVT